MSEAVTLFMYLRQIEGLLQQALEQLTKMSRATESESPSSAVPSDNYGILREGCLNHLGTLASAYLNFARMAQSLPTSGQADSTATLPKKPTRDLHEPGSSQAQPRARNSTRSTPKRAKRARTGGKSSRRSRSDDLVYSPAHKAYIHKKDLKAYLATQKKK